jgi:hypothetical protein
MVNMTGMLGLVERSGLMMLIPLAVAGATNSGSAEIDWAEMSETEYHEPLIEGGDLIALVDYMQEDVEESVGNVLAQLELHLDPTEGTLTVYVVDAEVLDYVRTTQQELVVIVFPEEGEQFELTLGHVASDLSGETVGDSAKYQVKDTRLAGSSYVNGMVQAITVQGATFKGVSIWCMAP